MYKRFLIDGRELTETRKRRSYKKWIKKHKKIVENMTRITYITLSTTKNIKRKNDSPENPNLSKPHSKLFI